MTQTPEAVDLLIWLPGATDPVLAGEIRRDWRCLTFTYDRAYLTRGYARNHAAFWNGDTRELTPAYDIAPQCRVLREANQAMTLANSTRAAQLQNVAAIAPEFGVSRAQVRQIVDQLVGTILAHWTEVCDDAGLSRAEQAGFAGRQFLNENAFDGYGPVPHLFARG